MKKTKDLSLRNQYISILLCWITYTSVYLGRYSYSANITLVKDFYSISNSEAGLVMTFFAVGYGLGQFFHGLFCKKYPKKFAIPLALTVTAIVNLLVFLEIQFSFIKYLWLISALFQGLIWPVLLQVISDNISNKLMYKAIIALSTTSSCGTLLVYGISAFFAKSNFKIAFLFGAISLIVVSLLWLLMYKKGDYAQEIIEENNTPQEKSNGKISFYILFPLILLVIFSIMTNFEKDGLQTWVPAILKQTHSLPDNISIILTLVLPLFGIFGSMLAVELSKKINKVMMLIIFFFSFVAFFEAIVIFFQTNLIIMVVSFGMLELMLHGVCNVITSIFPLQMRKSMDPGTLTGILNGSAYIGSATSAYLLGKIADISGWNMVFVTLLGTIVAGILLASAYAFISSKNKNFTIK